MKRPDGTTLTTTENGVFIFTNLVPTTLLRESEMPGFRTLTERSDVDAGDRLALGSIQLEIGQTMKPSRNSEVHRSIQKPT